MRHSRLFLFLMVATAFAVSPACGGGGHGFGVAVNPLVITGNTIDPNLQSGDEIDWEIPLGGGCLAGTPYMGLATAIRAEPTLTGFECGFFGSGGPQPGVTSWVICSQ